MIDRLLIAVSAIAILSLAGLTGVVGYTLGQGNPVVTVVEVERLPRDTAEALGEAAQAVSACVEATGLKANRRDWSNRPYQNRRTRPDARLWTSGGQGGGRGARADVPARLLASE